MQYLVLGMHRSGTSAVVRLLNLMGCHVGPEDMLLGTNQDNPVGYWERMDVLTLNQKILAAFGACAYRVGHLEPEVLASRALPELEGMGRRILERLEPHRPWVAKDPRMCLTLPFWKKLLAAPICVLVYRSPLQVARSLETREGLPTPYAIALWEKYNLSALEHARGLPRTLISHRELMERPFQTAASLHRDLLALGAEWLRMPTKEVIEASIDPQLYRERSDDGSLESQHLNLAQARVLEALRDRTAIDWEEVPALSRGARDILINYAETIDPSLLPDTGDRATTEQDDHVARHVELERQLENLDAKLDRQLENLERLNREMESRLEILEHGITGMAQETSVMIRRLDQARERFDSKRVDWQETQTRLLEGIREKTSEAETLDQERGRLQNDLSEAVLARENVERERRTTVALLEGWILELDAVISAILESRSWRLGSTLRELARRLLFRTRKPLAVEYRTEIMRKFELWRKHQEK